MQSFRIFIAFIALFVIFPLNLSAHYFSEVFTNTNSLWGTNFMARGGVVWPSLYDDTRFVRAFSNLRISGDANNNGGGIARNGFWKGQVLYCSNRYNATPVRPFGFEVMRTNALIAQGGTADARFQSVLGIWLFVMKSGFTGFTEWDMVDDFSEFYDWSGDLGVAPNHAIDIGYFDGVSHSLSTKAATNAAGMVSNLSNIILWDYLSGGTRNNSNKIGFRITHDGTTMRYYANPDPYDWNPSYPNEWFFLGSRVVAWASNMQIGFGHAVLRENVNTADAIYRDLLVRSAVTETGYYLDPSEGSVKGSRRIVSLHISNHMRPFPENAGLNTLRIVRTAHDEFDPLTLNQMQVTLYSHDARRATAAKIVPWDNNRYPKADEVAVMTQFLPEEIRLVLGTQVSREKSPGDEWVTVKLPLKIRGTPFFDKALQVYVDAEQFDHMAPNQKNRYATCGWQLSPYLGDLPSPTVTRSR